MYIEHILFYIIGAMALGSALMVVATPNLVRSIFLFFITLFSVAGLYVFALADFVALTQIVIYVGGVLVLMLFAFLLSNKEQLNRIKNVKTNFIGIRSLPGILLALVFLFVLVNTIIRADVGNMDWIRDSAGENTIQASDNTIQQIGILLITRYLLPFEVISVLLMVALIGAAHLTRKGGAE